MQNTHSAISYYKDDDNDFQLSIYLSIYGIYIAPLQGNYSEALNQPISHMSNKALNKYFIQHSNVDKIARSVVYCTARTRHADNWKLHVNYNRSRRNMMF